MLLLIFLLTLLSTNAIDNDFVIFGMHTNFTIITGLSRECNYGDYSCNNILCNMLANTSRCIPYIALVPISSNPKCSQKPVTTNVNMIVFGIDPNFKITGSINCATMYDCLTIGCKMMYNSDTMWVLYTGACQKKLTD